MWLAALLGSVLGAGQAQGAAVPGQPAVQRQPVGPPAPPVAVYVAYPAPDARIAFDHVILEGSVRPGASLTLNGRRVEVGPDGLFMEWLPLAPGPNRLRFVSVLGGVPAVLERSVTRSLPASVPRTPTSILNGSAEPRQQRVWYGLESDPASRRLSVSVVGSAGGAASFSLGGRPPAALRETSPGHYSGGLTLAPADVLSAAPVVLRLRGPDGRTATGTAPGRVTLEAGPREGVVTAPDQGRGQNVASTVWTDEQGQNVLFPLAGTQFTVLGRVGSDYLTRLPGSGLVTVPGESAALLPPGTPAAQAVLGAPTLSDDGRHLILSYPVSARVPLRLTQTEDGLELRLEQARAGQAGADPASLALPTGDPLTAWSWTQEGAALVGRLPLDPGAVWGYSAAYVPDPGGAGDTLEVSLRRPLEHASAELTDQRAPLAGLKIVLDPGHGGSQNGGAGALRVPEKGLTLPIAQAAAAELRALGATVTLTRESDVTLGLYQRTLLAQSQDADLLISIHANALPDGRDPRGVSGAEVYYSWPQAAGLARALLSGILAASQRAGPGLKDGGLHADANLALTRPSAQPSLLLELGYLTDAGDLRRLMSPDGQAAYARGVAQGVLDWWTATAPPTTP